MGGGPQHQRLVEEPAGYAPAAGHASTGYAGTGAARGFTQLIIFGRKNFTLALRNWKGSIGQLFSPVIIVLLLFGRIEKK
jgi:hypothetical protein